MHALGYVSQSTMAPNKIVGLFRETLECLAQCAPRCHITKKNINCCMNFLFINVTFIRDREKPRRDVELDPKNCEFPRSFQDSTPEK
jgi:hypothetical protein